MSAGRIVILGAGESGYGAAMLAKKQGFDVIVSARQKHPDTFNPEITVSIIEYKVTFRNTNVVR